MSQKSTVTFDSSTSPDARLERAIAALRETFRQWKAAKAYGKLGFEVDMEAGNPIVGRVTSVMSVK